MRVSRRRALEAIGVATVGGGAAACGAARSSPQSAAAPATGGLSEFRVVFAGLQLIAIEQNRRVVIAMPETPPDVIKHDAVVAILGGSVRQEAHAGPLATVQSSLGVPVHVHIMESEGLRFEGASSRQSGLSSLTIHDDGEIQGLQMTTKPQNPDQWRSLRRIPDLKRRHPKAVLRKEWEQQLTARVDISAGAIMALPGYDEPSDDPDYKGHYFSHFSTLRLPVADQVRLIFEKFDKSSTREATLAVDSTGPIIAFVCHVPRGNTKNHKKAIEALFDQLEPSKIPPAPHQHRERLRLFNAAPGFEKQANAAQLNVDALLAMLNDGSVNCPPNSFRF